MRAGAVVVLSTGRLAGSKLRAVIVTRGGEPDLVTYEVSVLVKHPWQPMSEATIDRSEKAQFEVQP